MSARLTIVAVLVIAVGQAAIALAPWWPLKLGLALVNGLTVVRLFVIYHDHEHRTLLHNSWAGRVAMALVGTLLLNPPSIWRGMHNEHHRHNGKLGFVPGAVPVLSTVLYDAAPWYTRRLYVIARSPLTFLLAYWTVFQVWNTLIPVVRSPKKHWQGMVGLLVHYAIIAALVHYFGWAVAVLHVVVPFAVAAAVGVYMLYVQHNYPGVEFRSEDQWDHWHAALKGSSFMEMPAWMHWCTANIGYHHIHHVNHRVPFYRLPEAMAAIPELQSPGRTSWRLRDVLGCMRLKLWDPQKECMVTFADHQAARARK